MDGLAFPGELMPELLRGRLKRGERPPAFELRLRILLGSGLEAIALVCGNKVEGSGALPPPRFRALLRAFSTER